MYTGAVGATSFDKTIRTSENVATVAEMVKAGAVMEDDEPKELLNVDQPPSRGTDIASTPIHEDTVPASVAANPTLQAEPKTSVVEKACQDPIMNKEGGSVRGQEPAIGSLGQVVDGRSIALDSYQKLSHISR